MSCFIEPRLVSCWSPLVNLSESSKPAQNRTSPLETPQENKNKHAQSRIPTPSFVSPKQEQTYPNSHPLVEDTPWGGPTVHFRIFGRPLLHAPLAQPQKGLWFRRAPKCRTKRCSRYRRPKFTAMKWLKCCKNQFSRSWAVSGWVWTPFCVILWGWLIGLQLQNSALMKRIAPYVYTCSQILSVNLVQFSEERSPEIVREA